MPPSPPARRAWDRAATTALFLSNGVAFGTWAANLPRLKEAQALSDADLGFLLLLVSIGATVSMPFTSWLAMRVGTARVASIAGLLGAAALSLPGLATSWVGLLASGMLLGVLLGTMDVAMNAQASVVEKGWGAAIMSSFHAGWSGGGLAAAAVAGALARAGLSLTESYALPSVLVALLAIPAFSLGGAGGGEAGSKLALPSRTMLAVAVLTGLCFSAEGAVMDWSGVYLRTELGTDAAWAASAYGFYSLAMAIGRLGGDAVVRRLGPAAVVRLGGTLAALGLAGALAAPAPWVADVALVLVGFGLSNIVPVTFSAAGRLNGTAGVAMAATTGYASFLISPPTIGGVADWAGLRIALALIVAVMLGMALLGRAVAVRPAGYSAVRSPAVPRAVPPLPRRRSAQSRRPPRPARGP